jgi:hypothetical protein
MRPAVERYPPNDAVRLSDAAQSAALSKEKERVEKESGNGL